MTVVDEFDTPTIDHEAERAAFEYGEVLGEMIHDAFIQYDANRPRSLQSTMRVLGMSELGGCREYIRASIAGDPKDVPTKLKWAAAVGTAVGEWGEQAIAGQMEGVVTQERQTVKLESLGIEVSGSADARVGRQAILDYKTKDGLATVRREGPSFKEKAQISGYLVGAFQQGVVDEDATGHLIYLDRSGGEEHPWVWSVTLERARLILRTAEERLSDVAEALATGRHAPRDEPESWCFAVGCPFYSACWDGYLPTGVIESERELDAVRRLVEARDDENNAALRRKNAKEDLKGVEGLATLPDGTSWNVKWTFVDTDTGGYDKLEVRPARKASA